MGEWQNLSEPHAALTIGLSDGAYSHSSCRAYPRSCEGAYPNGRMVGAVKAAHAAGSWFVRKYMLSPEEGAPEWGNGKICRSRTRC